MIPVNSENKFQNEFSLKTPKITPQNGGEINLRIIGSNEQIYTDCAGH